MTVINLRGVGEGEGGSGGERAGDGDCRGSQVRGGGVK